MAFNLTHIEISGKKLTKQTQSTDKFPLVQTPAVKHSTDKLENKYPVRVFTIQPQS